jgi:4-carboxymuconolactone decarboxylase
MNEMFEKGLRNRAAVMGQERPAGSAAPGDGFGNAFSDFAMRYCWGELWSREGLPWKTRSLINIALLAAMNRPAEFKLHVGGAINNGATKEEIEEVLMQVVVYCGLPAGSQGLKLAKEFFAESEAGK